MGGRNADSSGGPNSAEGTSIIEELRSVPFTFYLLPGLLFVVVPSLVAWNNDLNIYNIPLWSWIAMVVLALLFFGALLLGLRLLERFGWSHLYSLFVAFVAYFVLISGFLFPVSAHTGMIDAAGAPVDTRNLAIAVPGAIALLIISETRIRKHVETGIAVFVGANVLIIAVMSAAEPSGSGDERLLMTSTSQNLFVVSFDGLSGTAMREAIRDPELRQVLDGFTVFEAAASSSPGTNASMVAELKGNQNFKEHVDTTHGLWTHSPSSLLTDVISRNGYEVVTYGAYGTHLPRGGEAIEPTRIVSRSALILVNMSIARTLTRAFVPRGWFSEQLGHALYPPGIPLDEDSAFVRRVLESQTPGWAKEYAVSAQDYYRWVDGLKAGSSEPVAYFVHFLHTHFPVEFDEQCVYRSDDEEWFQSNQNYAGSVVQAECALQQFKAFLEKIKELGILEESMIIFKSDHGQPVNYAREGSIEASLINGAPTWGLSRYAPFLAVKPLGVTDSDSVSIDPSPVLIDDLARTICEELQIDYHCGDYPGYNIVGGESIPPDDEVTVFVTSSPDADYRYETHEAIKVRRGHGVVQSMYEFLSEQGQLGILDAEPRHEAASG